MPHLPVIGITMGDPAGIGPEVIVKALSMPEVSKACQLVVIGDGGVMAEACRRFAPGLRLRRIPHPSPLPLGEREKGEGDVPLLDLQNVKAGTWRHGVLSPAVGPAVVGAIQTAARLALAGRIDAVVTAPIQKGLLDAAGAPYPGHTEFLADLAGTKEVGMMLVGGSLRVMLVTTHVALQDLVPLIRHEAVARAIRLAVQVMRDQFGIATPKVGVAGLNPHAGEQGRFGTEEADEILPAVTEARGVGLEVSGPHPADTLFHRAARGEYDIIVAMYHDQALIPVKLLAFGHAVNVTVGLPFVRTSPDHGTAYDLAGKGVADPTSLIEAIGLAARLAGSWRRSEGR